MLSIESSNSRGFYMAAKLSVVVKAFSPLYVQWQCSLLLECDQSYFSCGFEVKGGSTISPVVTFEIKSDRACGSSDKSTQFVSMLIELVTCCRRRFQSFEKLLLNIDAESLTTA